MREIKFRAYHKGINEMYYNDVKDDVIIKIGLDGDIYYYFRSIRGWEDGKPEDLILMQYTGIKDKKGKEIYEGDILKESRHGALCKHVVEYSIDDAGYDPFQTMCFCEVCGSDYLDSDDCEVIGNIHQNPELLEAK